MSSFQLQNSEVLARLKPFGISFEKSLNDLIKGIRAHSKDSPESLAKFLDIAIQECKSELYTTDLETKAMAILKLSYLEMYGFDMSWCNFQVLEVMSSNKFQQKRIGYLAAIQSFKNEQELLILATNQFKKDLNSSQPVEVGLALSGVATIVTPTLSKDINDDILMKLNHSKPYIRKKAILALYKIFLQYPDSLRMNFHKVIEKLDDSDISVVSATINVICELSKKNPKIFLNYLPKFFEILEETKNNWLIIRILKLFQSLSKIEPRMKKKILPAIMELMLRTQASSLVYECINCAVNGQMLSSESHKDRETAKLCIEQLMSFFKTKDSNLKFVGLLALINILKIFPIFMHKIDGVSTVIMDCLNDPDLIIKRKALEVSNYLVNEDNIAEVVKVMLLQLIPEDNVIDESLKLDVTIKILQIASQDNYSNIPNFKWYVAVLKDVLNLTLLSKTASSSHVTSKIDDKIAIELGKEFKTLATKVPSIRSTLLQKIIIETVMDENIINICPTILRDTYWILGEYIDEVKVGVNDHDEVEIEDEDLVVSMGKKLQIFNCLIKTRIDDKLGNDSYKLYPISAALISLNQPQVICVLIQTLVKLYNGIVIDYTRAYSNDAEFSSERYNELTYHLYGLIDFLSRWEKHQNYEVQERTLSWLEFLKVAHEAMVGDDKNTISILEAKELESMRGAQSHDDMKVILNDDSSSDEVGLSSASSSEDESDNDNYESLVSDNENSPPTESKSHISELETNLVTSNGEKNSFAFSKKLPALISHILPSFFKTYPLNPIAKYSQSKISVPHDLDLDTRINDMTEDKYEIGVDDKDDYELDLSESELKDEPLIQLSSEEESRVKSSDRLERLKDDPYYLDSGESKKKSSKTSEKFSLMNKNLKDSTTQEIITKNEEPRKKKKAIKLQKEKVLILGEESIDGEDANDEQTLNVIEKRIKPKSKNSFKIDSSNLDNFDFDASTVESSPSSQEYNIDLDALREKLVKSTLTTERKKKSKVDDLKTNEKAQKQDTNESNSNNSKVAPIVTVKPKKKKNKKKAVIIE
ncbi:apl5 [Candida pseudojiufengensis]|uniref:apl5 n=1 Tax=Candida pseudojiufengensis TaxID=497109 RepID=UPI0022258418|nr:apl5 [Candida pseudojiufengensis]KAI5960447.1 apl5 [Candida pseudojiufengensis]